MPLTSKGEEILKEMEKNYKSDKKAEQVFYASIKSGKIIGAEGTSKDEVHEIITASISLSELQKKNEEYWAQSYDLMNKDIEVE